MSNLEVTIFVVVLLGGLFLYMNFKRREGGKRILGNAKKRGAREDSGAKRLTGQFSSGQLGPFEGAGKGL
ncbi:hypothetical protein HY229_04695 [Candidatus Acetothermia bacterium]|nr:hypothetical protein [Candidatus Acetothermia bacterium]MBI3643384.1 hypothetical protein [Candidatus Acetothermia bacterium]